MYKVKMDGKTLYYPGDKEASLINPVLKLAAGYAGSFECTIPATNPLCNTAKNRKSMISVYQDSKEIFYGEVKKMPKKDRHNNQNIYCAGAMSFLADSLQPQAEYHDMSPYQMLKTFLDFHNGQVEERKKIYVGVVSVKDANNSLYRYTNFENTLKAIREKLVDKLGGYLRLRHENNKLYLDWITIEEYGKYCQQPIEFGLNLLDYAESKSGEPITTALVPLGSRLQGESEIQALEKYVDITSVNGGSNYIYNKEATEEYGWIWDTHTWNDVTEPSNLLRKGKEYLESKQFEEWSLELTAVNLSMMDKEYESFEIGDIVPCRAKPYGMNTTFPVMEMEIPLQRPDSAKLNLGSSKKVSFTEWQTKTYSGITASATESRKAQNEMFKNAMDNLTAKMTGSEGGYKLTEFDSTGRWLRDLYMDAPEKEKATNILQINKNGIAGSHNGYEGPYEVGMTLAGEVIGEKIIGKFVGAEQLTVEFEEQLEGKFSDTEKNANAYADQRDNAMRQNLRTSLQVIDDKITMAVTDQKSITNRYDYITNGDNQTINTESFVEQNNLEQSTAQINNINCIKLVKKDANTAAIKQSLGVLKAGEYTVEVKVLMAEGTKPTKCYFGLTGATQYKTFSTMNANTWYTISAKIELNTDTNCEFMFAIYGTSGSTIYVTDIRALRDIKEVIDDVDARITVESGKITQKVQEQYEANCHNYCVDGIFENSKENWYYSDSTYVYDATYKDRKCACINLQATTNTNYYVRSKTAISNPKTGKFTIRFKACSKNGNGRIRVYYSGTKYTNAGEIGTEWTTVELVFDTVAKGNNYLYFYSQTSGDTIYITDVQILGYATQYNEAQIQLTSDQILAEVTRAQGEEEKLNASIKLHADKIEMKVSKGNVSSSISAESEQIKIVSNRISITSTNFTLTAAGFVTMKGASCQGTFEAINGDWFIKMSYGQITGGYKNTIYGYIDFAGGYSNSKERTIRIRGNSRVDIMGNLYTATSYNASEVWETFTGTKNVITNIRDLGDGAIQWTIETWSFKNGILLG